MGIGKTFNRMEVVRKGELDDYTAIIVLGQMIKIGLIEFDKYSGLEWHDVNQEYMCTPEAELIVK
jgi:hypothetical protein